MRKAVVAAAAAAWLVSATASAQAPEAPASLACSFGLVTAAYPVYLAFAAVGPIDACMALRFVTFADQVLQTHAQSVVEPEELRILLHSPGGTLSDAAAMVGAIERLQSAGIPVHVVVDAQAAGAAILIFAAADRRSVAERAILAFSGPELPKTGPSWMPGPARWALGLGEPPPQVAWWQNWERYLAERLGASAEEIRRLIDDRRWIDGAEAVRRGWAKASGKQAP